MKQQEIAVLPEIAQKIVDLQMEHDLPISIALGGKTNSLQIVTLEYMFGEDALLVQWMVKHAENMYARDVEGEYIDEDYDYERQDASWN